MHDSLAQLHTNTYNSVADEYEKRVKVLKPLAENTLKDLTVHLHKESKVLDIGCAVGYTVEILRKQGMIVDGIDIAPEMIKYARKRNPNNKFVVGDFLETQFSDNEYDGILAYAFIHLFPKETALKFINKMVLILKPGGYLLAGTTRSEKSSEGFEQKDGYKLGAKRYRKHWTAEELEAVFKSCGLEIVDRKDHADDFGKVWMDYVLKKPVKG